MSDIRIHVDIDAITLNDLIELEDGATSARFLRDFIAKFMVDDNGDPIEYEQACKDLGALTIPELRGVGDQLAKSLAEFQQSAVPKGTSG